ncbi:ATP-binding protein [Melioribacteraceae bacterium 4301-Me]|uniref:ATP-binding protein n=1 Tax=Pyranulibacter aquaticus TaxID=3163344 RepID=UPI003595A3F3
MERIYNTIDSDEQRYYRLLNYLTDYIYTVKVKDGKAVETYHGPGCVAVTGYTSEDYKKDPELWYRMVHKDDREAVLEQANQALSGKNVQPLEHRIIHRDGTIRWVKNSIVLSKDEFGNVLYYDGLINDITELKRAEKLAEAKQAQLIQADKMVALGTMVSGFAHEVNNPNNYILLNAQFIQKVWDDIKPILNEYYEKNGDFVTAGIHFTKSKEKIETAISSIIDGAMRIQNITRSLTDFARKDTGELNQDVNLNQVIKNAAVITGSLIKKSTDNFVINYNYSVPLIKGNQQQLEQVLVNLISNACHSLGNRDKGIKITLLQDNEENSAVIEVADEGIGIKTEYIKHIFDPFFTTKRDSGGTGLGLYISYNIIKSHGGKLTLKSEKGKGSTFRVILPINK